jgi:hypothetical protein
MAEKGTDGTDLTTTLTTAGDVVYKGASALTRLAKGTASQVLTMNSGATAPEWADAAGGADYDDHWKCWVNSTSYTAPSNGAFNFGGTTLGTNISYSSGTITVTNAGVYFITITAGTVNNNSGTISLNLKINGNFTEGRIYKNSQSTTGHDGGVSMSWVVNLSASDTLFMYSESAINYYGSADVPGQYAVTKWEGIKIG